MDGQHDKPQDTDVERRDRERSNYMLRVRVDHELSDRAAAVLHAAGLTITDAVRTLLIRIAEDRVLPYRMFPPSDEAIAAARRTFKERERTYTASRSRRQENP